MNLSPPPPPTRHQPQRPGRPSAWPVFLVTLFVLLGLVLSPAQVLAAEYTLGTTNLLEGPAAGAHSVVLAVTPPAESWTARANDPWLHLDAANANGTGSTNVVFTFDANPGATRTGTLTVGDQTLAVTQAGSGYVAASVLMTLVASGVSFESGVAVDRAGNAYFTDPAGAVQKWTVADGTVATLFSWRESTLLGVAVDGAGNVYTANGYPASIAKWTRADGTVTTLAAGGLGDAWRDLAVDGAGNVFFADPINGMIKKWTAATGHVTTLVPLGLAHPFGVALDAAGNVYIADSDGSESALRKWTAANSTLATLASSGLDPWGLAVDGAGSVFIADSANHAIKQWTPAHRAITTLVSAGRGTLAGAAVDGAGNVIMTADGRLQEFPRAFVNPTARFVAAPAGTDELPAVLPVTANLLLPQRAPSVINLGWPSPESPTAW